MSSNTKQNWKSARRSRTNNVISMRFDAPYFYERGLRFLERNDLNRALKAFRKTVEYEPDNPVNHCNLAGVLSELGNFEASNEVLMHVLKELDPEMAECQFYLANNYANMGEYELAEDHVLRYLDAEPDGEYAEDAEEMLDVLLDEFGGGKVYAEWEAKRRQDEQDLAKLDGRHLLEQGQFEAAVEQLEALIRRNPGNTAARNNLSLAYYYTGQCDRAIATAEQVLAEQPQNIHALCNVTVFTAQVGTREQLQACVAKLVKLFPLHYDHAMKLGTTLGLAGEHGHAFSVFHHLVRMVDRPEPILLHSLAASAANAGRIQTARKWWKLLSQTPEMKEVALYYLEHVDRLTRQGKHVRVSYQYDMPLRAQFAEMKKRLQTGDLATWRQDPLLRASLYWGLRHGAPDTRKAVIRTLALLADADGEKALRLFLKRADVDPSLRAAAMYALQRTHARGRVEFWKDGELQSLRMSDIPKDIILQIDSAWQIVQEQVEQRLRACHKSRYIAEAKRTWVTFLRHAYLTDDLRMVKPEIWAAALVYHVLRRHHEPVRQRDVALWFGISTSSLGKAFGRLDRVCGRS